MKFQAKGHDGKTADLPCKPNIPASPVFSKITWLHRAASQCGNCGTSDVISGRPGSGFERFECRSCRAVNIANGGVPFTFWGEN